MSNSNFGKGLLAFLGGAAVGAALGILFAPDKGSKTRKKVAATASQFSDDVAEKLEDLVDSAESVIDDLKEAASDFVNACKKDDKKHKADERE